MANLKQAITKILSAPRYIGTGKRQIMGDTHALLPEGRVSMTARLSLVHFAADGSVKRDYGVVSTRLVTGAFVTDIVANLVTAAADFDDYKYHDCGTGTTAEANTQTALVTPYGGSRESGTQVAGGTGTAPTYTSVATITFGGSLAITEHGLFNASSTGTLMDRSVFSAVNVSASESIQFTYVLTINAET